MLIKPDSCKGCPLHTSGVGFVPPAGSGDNHILIVGEHPHDQDAKDGVPFMGASGFYLDRLLRRAGLDRAAFRMATVTACVPPGDKLRGAPYEHAAIHACAPYLDRDLARHRPRVILALGSVALRRLTGGHYGDRIARLHNYVLPGPLGTPVIGLYDPQFLLPRGGQANTSRHVGSVVWGLRRAIQIAADGHHPRPATYLCDPSPLRAAGFASEFESALAGDSRTLLSWDIETAYKLKVTDEEELSGAEGEEEDEDPGVAPPPAFDPILRISFCWKPGYAMSIPWTPPYMAVIRRLLWAATHYVTWNGAIFDVPAVQDALGERLPGTNLDFMWAWHLLQSDLPRGLEAVSSWFTDLLPWKHESQAKPAWYSAVDADAALRCAEAIRLELIAHDQWDLFWSHIVELHPILLVAGHDTGVHIHLEAQARLRTTLEDEKASLEADAQALVPAALLPRKRYARPPAGKAYTEVLGTAPERYCGTCGLVRVNKNHPCVKAGGGIGEHHIPATQFEVLGRFNPNSVQQLLAYVRHFRHPWAENRKTHKISLPKKHLQRLDRTFGVAHPIYRLALRLRGVKKTLGTNVNGYKADARGRIYTTYTDAPSSGRLASRAKNLQNVSHRGTALFAREVRRTIIPSPGMVFVEADSSAVEAVITGRLMGSESYEALAKVGIHDYLNCLEHGLRFPDDIARSKGEFGESRARKKVTVHGVSYGMTARLLYYENYEIFPSERAARAEIDQFLAVCPGLAEWQDEVRRRAHKDTYLVSPWGYRHYFYDVFGRRRKDGDRELGTDAKRCVSFLPQNSASAFMKDNIRMIAKVTPALWRPANFVCHDSYLLQVPPAKVQWAVGLLKQVLTRAIPQLGGLRIGCEIKVSNDTAIGYHNWADTDTVEVCTV